MTIDLYQVVTDRIITQIEAGVLPWVRPWSSHGVGSGSSTPINAVSRKAYRGINTMLLWKPPGSTGEQWMTYKQGQEIGAQVRKGEHGSIIVFYKPWKVEDKNNPDGASKTIPVLRSYTVFHTSQFDNLPKCLEPKPIERLPEIERIERADNLLRQANITHGGDRAYYSILGDAITLPQPAQFKSREDYYATALHELTHWTGHRARLDREYGKRFGDGAYAREELVAEMGAAFLCSHCGIAGKLQHANYLASWLAILKADKRAIMVAAGAAQKAADFVMGVKADAVREDEAKAA